MDKLTYVDLVYVFKFIKVVMVGRGFVESRNKV